MATYRAVCYIEADDVDEAQMVIDEIESDHRTVNFTRAEWWDV